MKLSNGILIVAAASLASTPVWSAPTDHTDLHHVHKLSRTKAHHASHAIDYHLDTRPSSSSDPRVRHHHHHKTKSATRHTRIYRLRPILSKNHKKYVLVLDKHKKHHHHRHHLALKWLSITQETVGNIFDRVRRTVVKALFA
ncbi:hypothetical protein IWQ62_006759 [Dispira parvispora]|uniref:Uncharacterized protein n=1 Tax=Dispira parvispora TaxID=1520584 RepID=A0A9W8DY83_9FUNG|nr:hypothetical protein IWQ62_006759 [Dispira parvispora]